MERETGLQALEGTVNYKTCPHCGQPMVLSMPRCMRCGYVFPVAAPHYDPAILARDRGRPVWAPWIIAGVLFVPFLFAALLVPVFMQANNPAREASTDRYRSESGDRGGSGSFISAAPREGGSPFTERPSARERPTIFVSNAEGDAIYLELIDADGGTTTIGARGGGQVASSPVDPGEYRVRVYTNNPNVQENTGVAVFRKFREYECVFAYTDSSDPLQLGDAE